MSLIETLLGMRPLQSPLRVATMDALANGANSAAILEFGVAGGGTLRMMADLVLESGRDVRVVGFDTFDGLPEDWRPGFPRGAFDCGGRAPVGLPTCVDIVAGRFEDTVGPWLASNRRPVALVHIDCDLYSSAACVLRHVVPACGPETVWVFDELWNYPEFEAHEWRALHEACEAFSLSPRVLATGGPENQSVGLRLVPR